MLADNCHSGVIRTASVIYELLIFVDGVQGATNIIGDVGRSALLNPVRDFQDGGFEGELIFVDLA